MCASAILPESNQEKWYSHEPPLEDPDDEEPLESGLRPPEQEDLRAAPLRALFPFAACLLFLEPDTVHRGRPESERALLGSLGQKSVASREVMEDEREAMDRTDRGGAGGAVAESIGEMQM